MSIRAMNWAMLQRTDGPSAQCVLYIVADTANENGVSVHADPDYIAERSRQSRATVFRRLNELEAAGALTRFKKYRPDGAPIYEIRLHLDREVDYSVAKEVPSGDEDQAPEAKSQIETLTGETPEVAPVRQAESHSCDRIENPSKSPLTPQSPPLPEAQPSDPGAVPYERFQEAYGEGSVRPERAHRLWDALTTDERELAIRGARAYRAQRLSAKKALIDPERFLRNRDLWSEFAPKGATLAIERVFVAADSREGRAWKALHVIARVGAQTAVRDRVEGYWLKATPSPAALALSGCVDERGRPDDKNWTFAEEGSNQFGAWRQFIAAEIGRPLVVRTEQYNIRERTDDKGHLLSRDFDTRTGARVPAPWPPRADGSWPEFENSLAKTG